MKRDPMTRAEALRPRLPSDRVRAAHCGVSPRMLARSGRALSLAPDLRDQVRDGALTISQVERIIEQRMADSPAAVAAPASADWFVVGRDGKAYPASSAASLRLAGAVLRLREDGLTQRRIADALGISQSTVSRVLARYVLRPVEEES